MTTSSPTFHHATRQHDSVRPRPCVTDHQSIHLLIRSLPSAKARCKQFAANCTRHSSFEPSTVSRESQILTAHKNPTPCPPQHPNSPPPNSRTSIPPYRLTLLSDQMLVPQQHSVPSAQRLMSSRILWGAPMWVSQMVGKRW